MSAMSTSSSPLDLPDHLFTAIDHVGIAVADLDAAIELYTSAIAASEFVSAARSR